MLLRMPPITPVHPFLRAKPPNSICPPALPALPTHARAIEKSFRKSCLEWQEADDIRAATANQARRTSSIAAFNEAVLAGIMPEVSDIATAIDYVNWQQFHLHHQRERLQEMEDVFDHGKRCRR